MANDEIDKAISMARKAFENSDNRLMTHRYMVICSPNLFKVSLFTYYFCFLFIRILLTLLYTYQGTDGKWLSVAKSYHQLDPVGCPEVTLLPLIEHYDAAIERYSVDTSKKVSCIDH